MLVLPSRDPAMKMNLKPTTIICVSGVSLAAWLYAAITPGRPPISSVAIAPAPIDRSGAALATEIHRLRERLRPDPEPDEPTRNPFAFRSRRRAGAAAFEAAAANDVPVAAATVADQTARLRLTLAGIAEDTSPGGPVRTAIISGNGQLFLAQEGDSVADRDVVYTIGNVSADSVELIDPRDGGTRRLTFK